MPQIYAAVQKGIEVIGSVIAKSFKFITALFKQTPTVTDEITVPVGKPENQGSYSNTMLAGLVNSHIKAKIDENTVVIDSSKSPQELIAEFEVELGKNPRTVVVLSEKAHDSVMEFIANCEDKDIKQRFYNCCNQSLARSNKFAPKNRDEIDELVKEGITKTEQQSSPVLEQDKTMTQGTVNVDEEPHPISSIH